MPRKSIKVGGAEEVVLTKVSNTNHMYASTDNTIKIDIHYRLQPNSNPKIKVKKIQLPDKITAKLNEPKSDGATTSAEIAPALIDKENLYTLKSDGFTLVSNKNANITVNTVNGRQDTIVDVIVLHNEKAQLMCSLKPAFIISMRKYSKDVVHLWNTMSFYTDHDSGQWNPIFWEDLVNQMIDSKTINEEEKQNFVTMLTANFEKILFLSGADGGGYASKTLKELQAIAKARKISYSHLKKAELIAVLKQRSAKKSIKVGGADRPITLTKREDDNYMYESADEGIIIKTYYTQLDSNREQRVTSIKMPDKIIATVEDDVPVASTTATVQRPDPVQQPQYLSKKPTNTIPKGYLVQYNDKSYILNTTVPNNAYTWHVNLFDIDTGEILFVPTEQVSYPQDIVLPGEEFNIIFGTDDGYGDAQYKDTSKTIYVNTKSNYVTYNEKKTSNVVFFEVIPKKHISKESDMPQKVRVIFKKDNVFAVYLAPQPNTQGGGNYSSKTLKELQAIAKARKISYSHLKKTELIAVLKRRSPKKKMHSVIKFV